MNCAFWKTKWLVAALACFVCSMALGDQLRVVVALPQISSESESARMDAVPVAALWQALVGAELSKSDLFALVERHELPLALREFEFTARTNGLRSLAMLGADCVLLSQWEPGPTNVALTVRVANTANEGIERELVQHITSHDLESSVQELVKQLEPVALGMLSYRAIHTAVSILDYESVAPFERTKWQERAIARRLRAYFQRQPGVLVLERERVDELLDEARMAAGGITKTNSVAARWTRLTKHFVISGTVNETQREGEPLKFKTVTEVRNVRSGMVTSVSEEYPASNTDQGMSRIESHVARMVSAVLGESTQAIAATNNRAREAALLVDQLFKLLHEPELRDLRAVRYFALEFPAQFFTAARVPFESSPERKATLLRAVQYLKAALLLDDANADIKAFLICLLRDRQIGEQSLALELAEELGWQSPTYQARAWRFLFQKAPKERSRRYRQLLIDRHAGSYDAKLAAHSVMVEVMDQYRSQPDLTEGIAAARPYFEKALAWSKSGANIDGEIGEWFRFTQLRDKKNLRDGVTREHGLQVIEEMIAAHRLWEFWICHAWLRAGHGLMEDEIREQWSRRTIKLGEKATNDQDGVLGRVDHLRIGLARKLMARGEIEEAESFLNNVATPYAYRKEARYVLAQCAFERGDFQRALDEFEKLAPYRSIFDGNAPSAGEWALRCEERLGASAIKNARKYSATEKKAAWQQCSIKLPLGVVSAMKLDGDDIWIGLENRSTWIDQSLFSSPSESEQRAQAQQEGGLVQFNRSSGVATRIKVSSGEGISHPWVTSIALTVGHLSVGTFGKGVDVFDKRTGRWRNFSERDGLPSDFIQCLDADDENLWAGAGRYDRGGVARFNFKSQQWRSFLSGDFSEGNSPPTNRITCIKVVNGRVWCGMKEAIASYDIRADRWQTLRREHYAHFTSIEVCANRIWFGADQYNTPGPKSGILNCNLAGEDWKTLSREDGLPDLGIHAMATDHERLILGTYGLMILEPERKHFTAFDLRKTIDGSHWGISPRAVLIVGNEIWIGARESVLKCEQ